MTYAFSASKRIKFPDWEINGSEDALILGPSGSGKTTLLHLLAGLLKPSTGTISVFGNELQEMSSNQLDHFRKHQFGMVFQKPHLVRSLSVIENIKLAVFLGGSKGSEKEIIALLEALGLTDVIHRKVHQISQGQSQRVGIARAVINKPKIIFGDEPTANLDDESCERVLSLLKKQAHDCRASLIIATHDSRIKESFRERLILAHSSGL